MVSKIPPLLLEHSLTSPRTGVWVYDLWQFLEMFQENSPLPASAKLTPLIISGAVAALCAGFILSRIGPGWIMTGSLLCFWVGNILTATAPPQQIYGAQVFVCTVVIPWGVDMSFPAATIILSNSVEKCHQGHRSQPGEHCGELQHIPRFGLRWNSGSAYQPWREDNLR